MSSNRAPSPHAFLAPSTRVPAMSCRHRVDRRPRLQMSRRIKFDLHARRLSLEGAMLFVPILSHEHARDRIW